LPLAQSALEKNFRLVHYGLIGSTNDEALASARSGEPGGLWILADAQNKGKGRAGRVWDSPPGNFYASLLLIDPSLPQKAAELGFVAGVALAHALRALLGGDERLTIKWPNDILHDGRKLAGILLESSQLSDNRFACVAGFGVNCGSHPNIALYPATDLLAIAGVPISPGAVLEALSAAMAHWLEAWDGGARFDLIRAEWLSLAAGLGGRIRVARYLDSLEGIFETIDASGRLILETETGRIPIEAADVFLAARPKTMSAGLP
jgi:BirA family biotin operon repressor/biotin-[acetyl-CoA-carboxylase] ligase